jgi:hypothetical protein
MLGVDQHAEQSGMGKKGLRRRPGEIVEEVVELTVIF